MGHLWCCSGGHHSAHRCITVVTFASAHQWDPASLDSFSAASTAVAPDYMQPCWNSQCTAALKSTIRKQSAPTKPAFSDSSMATRCPADRPGWRWQGQRPEREQWGWWSGMDLWSWHSLPNNNNNKKIKITELTLHMLHFYKHPRNYCLNRVECRHAVDVVYVVYVYVFLDYNITL